MNRQVVGGSLIGLGVVIALLMLLSRGLGIPLSVQNIYKGLSSQPKSATVPAKASKPSTQQPRNPTPKATPKLSNPHPSPRPKPIVDGMW